MNDNYLFSVVDVNEDGQNVYANTGAAGIFRGIDCRHCSFCDYVTNRMNSGYTCRRRFVADDDSALDLFYCEDDNNIAAYRIHISDSDSDAVIACARRCRCTGVNPRDWDDLAYTRDYVYCYSDDYSYTYQYAIDNLCYCSECGNWYQPFDWDSDADMCKTCASDRSIIGDWHEHKGCFVTVGDDGGDGLTLGIELEVDGGGGYNDDMARDIDSAFTGHFVFENDCSLNTGFEIISQPHTLDAWRALDIDKLCKMLIDNDYTSHDAGTCGLHVHFSTRFLGDDDAAQRRALARVLRWYDDNFDVMLKLSRRDDSYCHYADSNRRGHDWDYHIDDIDNDGELVDHSINASRYVAVNCKNFYRYHTIEYRLARGTLRAATIRAWIDFHIALMTACQRDSEPALESVLALCDADTVKHVLDRAFR